MVLELEGIGFPWNRLTKNGGLRSEYMNGVWGWLFLHLHFKSTETWFQGQDNIRVCHELRWMNMTI